MNDKDVIKYSLFINLNYNNPYSKLGLLVNPSYLRRHPARQSIEHGLALGCPKSSLPRFLKDLGLPEEVVNKIMKVVKSGKKYFVDIEWNKKTQEGRLTIRGERRK